VHKLTTKEIEEMLMRVTAPRSHTPAHTMLNRASKEKLEGQCKLSKTRLAPNHHSTSQMELLAQLARKRARGVPDLLRRTHRWWGLLPLAYNSALRAAKGFLEDGLSQPTLKELCEFLCDVLLPRARP
jgi:hypothetical protein